MRNFNPKDLEELSGLLDGKGGLKDGLDEAFTRASRLGVSDKLTTLKPMRSWVSDTAPDLRKRAALGRLKDGDPEAGLRMFGFSTADLKNYNGSPVGPDTILLANSLAASEDPKAGVFQRQDDESLNDWVDRIKAHALSLIPGLQPHEGTIQYLLGLYGDWTTVRDTSITSTAQAAALTKILVGNAFQRGWARSLKIRAGTILRRSDSPLVRLGGNKLVQWGPKIRSLSAPGSWFPGQLAQWARGRIPGTGGLIGDLAGARFDAARRLRFMRQPLLRGFTTNPMLQNLTINRAINFVVGSDTLAARFGGMTHSGVPVSRAGNASLRKVTTNIYSKARGLGFSRTESLGKGLAGAGKVAGLIRGAGIVGSAAETGRSVLNVASQGWPDEAFKKKGAAYVADVAEAGFNASMTAAMIAPNPITVGAAVVTGGVYVGAKVVEHWKEVKEAPGKAAHWIGDKAQKARSGIANGAKSLAKKANPMHWF
ncbi:PE-PGRS family protein [Streptomyces roseoverticillatus]|uniref:PE-PGRS family protein n=1 Tax=Streptomyces roseoverticillatus TaxID=66429 RepID=A0ABV3IVI5_9ACTN